MHNTSTYSPTATTFDKAHIATKLCAHAADAVERGDADMALQHVETAIRTLTAIADDYDIPWIEVLPSRRCEYCGRDAVEHRTLNGLVICNICERDHILTKSAHEAASRVVVTPAAPPENEPKTGRLNREKALDLARDAVADRQQRHGSPTVTFARIASTWTTLLGVEIKAVDVAICLAALKLVRATADPQHADNWVDLAGYGACGAEVAGATHKKEVA